MTLEERVSLMEKQNRRLKVGLGVLALVVAAGVVMGATRQTPLGETVEAQAFMVKDKQGKIRAALATFEGQATLQLYDADGKRHRMELTVLPTGQTSILLSGTNGIQRVSVGVTTQGDASLQLNDVNGKKRASLDVLKSGEPVFNLYDAREKLRANLYVDKDHTVLLNFLDTAKTKRIAVGALPTGAGIFAVYNAAGKPAWVALESGAETLK